MKVKKIRLTSTVMSALLLSLTLSGCGADNTVTSIVGEQTEDSGEEAYEADMDAEASDDASETDGDTDYTQINTDITGDYSEKAIAAEWSDSEKKSTLIELSDDGTDIKGENSGDTASEETDNGAVITITKKGTYVLSGNITDGQIVIDCDEDDNVQLVLNGVQIGSSSDSPIIVKSAKNVYLTLAEGTENAINDNRDKSEDEESESQTEETSEDTEENAAVYSECDLIINGTGSLSIYGGFDDAVNTKDDLTIISGNLTIDAADDGLNGHDSVSIRDGQITIDCGDDCIKSSNEDLDKGFTVVDGGSLTLSSDKGHGINAENALVINAGTIDITESYEGLQSRYIVINDGDVNITASDDGINVSASVSSSAQSGMKDMKSPEDMQVPKDMDASDMKGHGMMGGGHGGGMGGGFDGDGIEGSLTINGGNVRVNAAGDGLDSNGSIYINGGYTVVSGSVDGGNAALDYATECIMNGGVLLLSGNRSMACDLSDDSEVTMLNGSTSGNLAAGTEVTLTDAEGNAVYTWTVDKKCNFLQAAGTDIDASSAYSFTADGESYDAAEGISGGFGR